MRPPIPYFGGKTALAEQIIATFPHHDHYVEPFAGSLAVLLAKPRVPMETVNDLDGALVNFWRVLRDRGGDMERVCALTPHSRAEYAEADHVDIPDSLDDLERARRVWVQLTQGRAGLRTKSGWRYKRDPVAMAVPRYLENYVSRISPAAERLAGVSLECRPALEVIADYGSYDGALLYVDPPYLNSTRSAGSYAVDMEHEDDHRQLADALRSCQSSVVLSGYGSPLYEDLYAGWHRLEVDAITIGSGGSMAGRREVLWSNRPLTEPDLLTLLAADGAA